MYSRKKASTKSHRHSSAPDNSSSQHDDVAPKVEFAEHSVGPEEAEAYWAARGESCPNGISAVRSFCRTPELVEFRLPEPGEVSGYPPEGYFRCYEAYLMQCNLWSPIPEIIVQLFDRFKFLIGQVNTCGLQHIVGILVLSSQLGTTLDADHLEALLQPGGIRP
ncbi:hypothetical protein F2Q68_00016791 [Brassica cretica]|uniref:Uncharacterized protein n=1 Tax=Brassica cretica TaxID=69181 RepID=A0A8S9HKV2_BRACR|nr:hypothetical protein F2Q68_00016791 [Brassica cretica]